MTNPLNNLPLCSLKVGENLLITILILLVISIFSFGCALYLALQKTRRTEAHYHVKIKFAHGIKTKFILNQEQYDRLKTVLDQKDGLYDIGDDMDYVRIYREHVCAVEVKKK